MSVKIPLKKQHIFETAQDLFQQFGIKRVSIEEICLTAKVSKMTFYKYFKNKNELIKQLLTLWFEEGYDKFDEIRAMDIPFQEKLVLLLKLKEEASEKISHQFALDYINGIPELQDFFTEQYTKGMQIFLDFLKEAQQNGEMRSKIRPEFVVAVTGQLRDLVNKQELVDLYPSYKDFVLEINNFMFFGLLPRN
jgi:AcrR family transcriptional regulator